MEESHNLQQQLQQHLQCACVCVHTRNQAMLDFEWAELEGRRGQRRRWRAPTRRRNICQCRWGGGTRSPTFGWLMQWWREPSPQTPQNADLIAASRSAASLKNIEILLYLTEREAVTQRNLSVRVEKTLIRPTWFCYANSRVVVQEADEPSAALVMNPAPSIPQVRSCAEGGRVTLERCTACLCDHANIQTPSPPFPTPQSDLLGRNPAHFLSDPPCRQQQQHQVTASTFIFCARSVKDNGLPVTQV